MEAELADGRILEFPDGTDPSVIQATVKKMLAGTSPAPAPGGVGVAGIPGTVRPPEVTPEPSLIDKYVRAPIETAASVATGIPATLTGQVSGIVANIFGGTYGTQAGTQKADKIAGRVADYLTYHPRGEAGQDLTKKVGDLSQNLVAVPIPTLGDLGHAAVPVVRAARDAVVAANPASDIGTVLASQRASKQIEAYRDTAQRAQAAKDAVDLNLKVSTAEANPTLKTRTVSTLAGGKPSVDAAASIENIGVNVPRIAREELGIAPEQVIDRNAFKQVYEEGAKPAQEIRKIPLLEDTDGSVTAQLEALRPGKVLGKSTQTGAVNAMIDDAVAGLEGGLSGDEVINSIQQNRKDARTILNSKETSVIDKAKARASLGIANSLETLIDNHLTATGDTGLLNSYKQGRALQAKAHVWEDAWDANTGKFDPQVIAEKTAGDNAITGNTLKVGQIAGNFPGAMSAPSASALRQFTDLAKTHLTRTGPLGVTGAALGTIIPGVGTAVGGLLGMAAGEIAAPLMRRGLMGGGKGIGQPNALPPVTSLSSPVDFSTVAKAPPMPAAGSTQVVPYDYAQTVNDPNFIAGRPEPLTPAPNVQATGVQMDQPQLGYRSARDAVLEKEAARSAAAKAAAEVQAAAESSVPRQPTRGGMLFDLDPVTGKLRAADQGVKGATPEIWQANTGANLQSASEKVAAGRTFDMTAAEKVAWNKTAVDIQEALPEFRGLTDKQVMSKMADRQWVQDTIAKVQQKAEMFAELEKRSNDRVAQSMARIQREKMMDMLEQLQDTLGNSRPVSSGAQGPKTRAFQRGMLTGENK